MENFSKLKQVTNSNTLLSSRSELKLKAQPIYCTAIHFRTGHLECEIRLLRFRTSRSQCVKLGFICLIGGSQKKKERY